MMDKSIHTFDNNVKVYERHLLDVQKERYVSQNVHEAEEESVFLDVLTRVKKGGKYINIGAAIGYYPILTAIFRSDIELISYEPLGKHRKYFYENIKLNGLSSSKFIIHKEGIYKRAGTVSFVAEDYGSKINEKKYNGNMLQKFIDKITNNSITCITLKDVADRERQNIDLLQMDIQGLEAGVLEADQEFLSSHRIKRFLIGTHSPDIHQRCINALTRGGYNIVVDEYETQLQPDGILLAEAD